MTDQHSLPPLPPMKLTICSPDADQGHWYSSVHAKAYGQACASHARKAALEEAAKVCDAIWDQHPSPECHIADICSDAIRELI